MHGFALIANIILESMSLHGQPFISMNLKVKVALTTTLVIVGEVSFWVGTLLIGKEVYKKFMANLKSGEWLEKKKKEDDHQLTDL